ncbi:MAG: helix-turn-helix domain-containing protein [Roseovarius sp.]|nr:helix-turn-helix domain-containing protein [Roseovarius sp.]
MANGTKFGRKPKLTDHQRELALERMAKGDTRRAIGRDLGVAHTTISRLR